MGMGGALRYTNTTVLPAAAAAAAAEVSIVDS